MDELIKALLIFRKYQNRDYPTSCHHDYLCIVGIRKNELTEEDANAVTDLGFYWSDHFDSWASTKFGSA